MNELLAILKILGVGLLAIGMVCMFKINDLTNINPNLNFWQVSKLFLNKAAPSYIASILALFIYAITRNDWAKLFIDGAVSPGFVQRLLGLQVVMAFFVGGGMQWGIYKVFLSKIDNIMKIWCGDVKSGGPDEKTEPPKIKEDGTLEKGK